MGQAAAAAQPEGVLVELLADPLRLQRRLAPVKRLQHRQRRRHQADVGEDAPEPGQPLVGIDEDEGVDTVLFLKLDAPAAFRRGADQLNRTDVPDFHLIDLMFLLPMVVALGGILIMAPSYAGSLRRATVLPRGCPFPSGAAR